MVDSSPFVGEHANAYVIEGENRSTHRAMRTPDIIRKYDSLISRDIDR